MIDLHIHTTYSDGDTTVENVLKKCQEKQLEYISITDHNTCKAYKDKAFSSNIYTGKVIIGAEMNANFNNKGFELLAYNIKNPEIIEEWSKKFFSEEILRKQQEYRKQHLLDICDKKGLIYNIDNIPTNIPITDYITIYIYKELMKHPENYPILGEFTQSLNYFIRKGLCNPDSEYYDGDNTTYKPMYKDVIDIIHDAGGLAFLAHPFEYRFTNTIEFINELITEKELDGIECFHPSATLENRKLLVEYAEANNLFKSGGSDYHGKKKPNIEIGIGNGDLKISKDLIKNWINF